MSLEFGDNNINASMRMYAKDYLLEFHKGFILNKEQYHEVTRLIGVRNIAGIEAFLREHFPNDAHMVQSMLDQQKQLKTNGYYDE